MKPPLPLVALIADSPEVLSALEPAAGTLDELCVPHEKKYLSAHYHPDGLRAYAEGAWARGVRTMIVGERGVSQLAGMIKGFAEAVRVLAVLQTTTEFRGLDSVASTLAMPPKVPVAVMGFDRAGAVNAAVFAADILAATHPTIAAALEKYRRRYREEVLASNSRLQETGHSSDIAKR